ncbi:calcium-binding protein [Enterovirga rhinocerotis]|uniref:Ca2+-binding RTX toxin-like protein n=1 Tax=Enterovirga rhinocerotis TaxID=1339210 RepID=A0A4R7BXD8_9HYPH|nr:calcium-binding protein [Enterovirga rhinocerotis]TDR90173.1 Ca2+-binding RTX toxin-like protein [Enterovirga rhinocerotis]
MATFIAGSAFNVNDPEFLNYFNNITDGTIGANRTSTYFRASTTVNGVSSFVDVYGSGFSYLPNGTPFFGNITRVVGNLGGKTAFELKDVSISVFPTLASWVNSTPQQILEEVFAGNDTIRGSAQADVISGFAGADKLYGLAGNDTYYVDNAGDRVFETAGQGTDTVFASTTFTLGAGQHVEVLAAIDATATTTINLTGNDLANTLRGNAGNNTLNGGAGADNLYGYGGNDTYVVDNAADRVFESAGNGADTVRTSVTYRLAEGQEVETLMASVPAATTAISLTGNGFANTLKGNAGANTLNGGGGGDLMYGYAGNDTYMVDHASDRVFESAGNGTDTVRTSVTYKLAAGQEIETLTASVATATTAINLTGNEFANTIRGNNGANVLNGGLGADRLQGFGGADSFVFDKAVSAANVDRIVDFVSGQDKIRLDDAIFTALDRGALSAEEFSTHFTYVKSTGILSYDADGPGGAAAIRIAIFDNKADLKATDFVVF